MERSLRGEEMPPHFSGFTRSFSLFLLILTAPCRLQRALPFIASCSGGRREAEYESKSRHRTSRCVNPRTAAVRAGRPNGAAALSDGVQRQPKEGIFAGLAHVHAASFERDLKFTRIVN
ncbi:hypothetical protein MRX96_029329 [Rhipicephalus microplus]